MPFVESTFDVVQVALLHIQQPIGHDSSIHAISINTEGEDAVIHTRPVLSYPYLKNTFPI